MKFVKMCVLSSVMFVSAVANSVSDLEIKHNNKKIESYGDISMCQLEKINVKMCELIKYRLNMIKNTIKQEAIANKYKLSLAGNIPQGFKEIEPKVDLPKFNKKDSSDYEIYVKRNQENLKKICEIHKNLDSNDREYLENLDFNYFSLNEFQSIYTETLFNDICE